MLTYNQHIELRDRLINGELDVELAVAHYFTNFNEDQRSWHTKDWKERRATFIKDKCQICSSQNTLTLQHLTHPRKYAEYLRDVTRAYANEYKEVNPSIDKNEFSNHVRKNYDYVPIPLCPHCKGRNPYNRKRKTPQYRCTECKHEFDNCVTKSADELISTFFEDEEAMEVRDKCFVSKDKWRNEHSLSNIRYWLQRERAKNQNAAAIKKEAFLLYLTDVIKYLSFEDTITACRTCAYNYDIKKMELCPKCNVHYKGIQYPTCIQCLPEDKRKAAQEIIEFGKAWQSMHKDLGVD